MILKAGGNERGWIRGLRVLHIGKYYPPYQGGMENFLKDLLHALQRKGTYVSALVHHHIPRKPFSGEDKDGLTIFRAPSWGQVLYAPISPSFPRLLRQSIRSFHPHLLHFHLPNTSAFWGLFVPEARSIPWVIQWQSDVVHSKIDRRMAVAYGLYRPFERYLLKRARSIVVTSRPYLMTSKALAPIRSKCHVVPLGLDPERLKMPEGRLMRWAEEEWSDSSLRVLAIGRLTYYKGHEVLIRAAAHIPDIRVLIVGEGERRPRLEGLIRELGLRERVGLLGFLEESRLHALLTTCDCLCLPSIERTEAFGLVLLEAMGFGKPLVASDIQGSGIGWVVKHKETGLLVRPGASTDLARALRSMGEMPELRGRMGRAAKGRFNMLFQIDRVAEKIVVIYRNILGDEV